MSLKQKALKSGFALAAIASRVGDVRVRRKEVRPEHILLLTSYTPNIADYGAISAENKRAYAERHGYGFRAVTEGFDPNRPPAWSKIRFIADALGEYRHVFWTDADALIMNPEVRLETFVESGADIHITRALTPYPHIQTGNFLVTRSPYARFFLWATWNATAFIHHSTWEQAAMIYLMDRYRSRRIKVSPNRLFNSLASVPDDPDPYQKGDFMVHFPGVRNRGLLMERYAALCHRAAARG